MTLEEIPAVEIDFSGSKKFIVVQLSLGSLTKMVMLFGDSYHVSIFSKLQARLEGSGIKSECLGGGKIIVDDNEKTMVLDGLSTSYGQEPDRQETVRLIQLAYPEFKVEAR